VQRCLKVDSVAPWSWTQATPFHSFSISSSHSPEHTLRSQQARTRQASAGEFRRGARCYRDVRCRDEIWHKVFGTCSRETFEYKFNGWGVENVLHAAASPAPTFHIQITQDCENNKNRDEQFLSADVRRRIQKPEANQRPLCVATAAAGPSARARFERRQIRRWVGGCRCRR
jgi:hypothetical protein